MTDMELLKFAAKATGFNFVTEGEEGTVYAWDGREPTKWNPLTDDGDALRLAVDLNFLSKHALLYAVAEENDRCNGDYRAAIRRAIVRVAADIGLTGA